MRAKVLLLTINFSPEPTGIAPYSAKLAGGLVKAGFAVRVLTTFPHYPEWRFTPGWEKGFTQRSQVEGVAVERLRHYVPRRPTGLRRAGSELSFAARIVGRRWTNPDVVISQSPALLAASIASVKARLGSVRPAIGIIAQDLYSAGLLETGSGGDSTMRVLRAIESRTLSGADGVVAIHPRIRRSLELLGVPSDRITVIRNWTHVSRPAQSARLAFRRSQGWRDDEFIVVHSGAMGEKQALGSVVEAARIADSRGIRVRFVLAGDGGQRERLQSQAAGVERLTFLAPVPSHEYSALLAAADLLLVNEKSGVAEMAVPSKLTSYFSSGRPVLAATGAGSITAEEVALSGAGIQVEPNDPLALLDATVEIADDPARARNLGARGLSYCASQLDESNSLDAYAAWVNELAHRRRDKLRQGT